MPRRHLLAFAATLTLAFVAQSCSSDTAPSAATSSSAVASDSTTPEVTATDATAVASTDAATTVPDSATPTTATAATNEPWALVPDGADFYTPPADLAERAVGSVIWSQPAAPIAGADVSKILYVSESLAGEPIAVSAMIAVPAQPAPPAGWPIITWAHGTTGSADICAPSVADQFSEFGRGYVCSAQPEEFRCFIRRQAVT